MDAIEKLVLNGHAENQKVRAAKNIVLALELNRSELNHLVAELALATTDLTNLNENANIGKNCNIVNIAAAADSQKKLSSQVIIQQTYEMSNLNLKEFIQAFEGKTKVLKGYPGMSIKVSRKEKIIQLRDDSGGQYFKLISYPVEHQFTKEDIQTIIDVHKRFMDRRKAKMPWSMGRENNGQLQHCNIQN